jgi:DNA ligase-4
LYSILSNHRCREDSILKIDQVNFYLDDLAAATEKDEKRKAFTKLIHATTATEQKWLSKIILKDLKCGIKHENVLRHYHQDAVDL